MKCKLILPLTILGAAVAIPTGSASAHNFAHVVRCEGIAWSATSYATNPNSIVVTIDGNVAYSDTNFGTTDQGTRTWSPSVAHVWRIVVDAPGTQYDHDRSGTQQPCSTPTTTLPTSTTTSTPTTTTPPPIDTSGPTTTSLPPSTSITVEVAEPPVPPTTRAPAFDSDCVGPDWVIRNRSTVAFTVTTPGGPVQLAAGVTYVVPADFATVTVAGVVFVRPGCTTVAVGEPPVPATPGLPVTGSSSVDPAWVVLLICGGSFLALLARRRS